MRRLCANDDRPILWLSAESRWNYDDMDLAETFVRVSMVNPETHLKSYILADPYQSGPTYLFKERSREPNTY